MPLFDSENEHSDPDRDSFPVDHNEDSVDDEHEEPYEPTAMDKVTGLQDETRRCLQRLDELSRVLKKAARDVQQQPPLKQSPSMGVEISQRMENLANIESNIEFARQAADRRNEERLQAKIRFSKMEASIKQQEDHILAMEKLVQTIPDNVNSY
mmetsp:Transcript_32451/g.62344  ORF Transcript_32451/g.62344 Transcript_32451/m.62344 type:complete len:154 (+) Transcript_32451:219-680(+)|eukprot:CAMPEP_0114224368 /NCGR_PEP_ID=MMETSP0058-20121206/70_1 /TAXON_ID=36894 /ORGANISM="Pyramimonas parkeae, CCMP726" /LENGTH=153 /DNA_ID=CAMNT_0001334839 /DNA_START=198 /DNA_END=659 /DNA_ORIENTATION=+